MVQGSGVVGTGIDFDDLMVGVWIRLSLVRLIIFIR